jgi:subtilase family serine protease
MGVFTAFRLRKPLYRAGVRAAKVRRHKEGCMRISIRTRKSTMVHCRVRRLAGLPVALGLMAAAIIVSVPAAAASGAAPERLITQSINERDLVTLTGNTRPEAVAVNDRGAVSDSLKLEHIYLQMNRSPAQERAAAALLEELHDLSSPQYHQWLSANEVAEKFGPSADDVAILTNWLGSHGFTVNNVYAANGIIDFTGSAGAVREAFHTEIHRLSVNGQSHIANVSDPRIPAALAPAIRGIVSLHDFRPKPALRRRTNRVPVADFDVGSTGFALVPGDLQTIYNMTPLYRRGISGQGQTIVVVEDSDLYSAGDWKIFRSTFGLDKQFPQGSLRQVHPQPSSNRNNGGACADPGANGDDGEATLDAEWASAAAPSATIVVAACANTNANPGFFIALQNLLTGHDRPPGIISMSYGTSESYMGSGSNAYISSLYQLAVFQGVSVFVSAGDSGADESDYPVAMSGININGYASTPYNVAVGGTDFHDYATGTTSSYWAAQNGANLSSALSYVPEIPWNDTCASSILQQYFARVFPQATGLKTTYGPHGTCNDSVDAQGDTFFELYPDLVAGGGGPSSCALGDSRSATPGVVDGTCRGYPKPFFQQAVSGVPRDGVRDLPDVSLFAGNGFWGHYYVVCYSDPNFGGAPCDAEGETPADWLGDGGTSFSSPIMAGIQALVNQASESYQGNPNYIYYHLADSQFRYRGSAACNSSLGNEIDGGCIFNDVSTGDIDVPCVPYVLNNITVGSFDCYYDGAAVGVLSQSNSKFEPAYSAGAGYDLASGLGSVNAFNLVRGWPGARIRD